MSLNALITKPLLNLQSLIGRIAMPHRELVRSAPRSAFPPEWHDLWFLYREVRARRPRLVLEFGSGCSTPIIAAALEENGAGKIVSVEASAEWLEVTRNYFPRHLAARCELVHSPAVLSEHDGNQVWRHSAVPDVVPDLIYLDGPPLQGRIGSIDVLDLEPRLDSGARLIVDGRKKNFAYLRAKLRRPWSFRWHTIAYRGVGDLRTS